MQRIGPRLVVCAALLSAAALPAAAQITFEQAEQDLKSPDAGTRLKTVRLLETAAYPEAAVPLAHAVTDAQDEVQFAAIAAELNIFLAERVTPRKKIGLVVEVRNPVLAEPAFTAGPLAVGPLPVPIEVLDALRAAMRDDNPRVAVEALYAFGVLAPSPTGAARRELLHRSGPDIAALLGAPDPSMRYAAARVIGRVFAWREHDAPIDAPVGDGVITALNDKDRSVKAAAMRALGALRYERSVQALTDLFAFYGSGDMAEAALGALAHIAHASSAPLFVTQLGAKSPAVRAIAIEGLARIGDATSLPKITAAADADSTDLVALAASFANVLLANGPVDRIADALTHARVHDRARDYLTEIAPGRSASFARFLLDPDERIRQGIVEALAVAGDAAALPLLEPLLQDRDPQVARLAERAVARLRARSAGA